MTKANEQRKKTQRHYWSKKLLDDAGQLTCSFAHLDNCKGRLEVAHIDQNDANNDISNLMRVCQSHHRLFDRGKLTRDAVINPAFRIRTNGRRRYLHEGKQHGVEKRDDLHNNDDGASTR